MTQQQKTIEDIVKLIEQKEQDAQNFSNQHIQQLVDNLLNATYETIEKMY